MAPKFKLILKSSMKKSALSLFLLSLAFSACSDNSSDMNTDFSGSATNIKVSEEKFTIKHEGEEFTLDVLADGDWHLNCDDNWISYFPTGGVKNETTSVKVKVASNPGFDSRESTLLIKSGNTSKSILISQSSPASIRVSTPELMCGNEETSFNITVESNVNWTASSDQPWVTVSPTSGTSATSSLAVKISSNVTESDRTAIVSISGSGAETSVTITQFAESMNIPEGYALVWQDEFNGDALSNDWTYEVKSSGWVNNELQNYVKNPVDGKYTVEVKNGLLNINCFKGSDGKVYSGRIYAKANTGWTYGYIEAKINLPSGKGTWPAFWMMPVNFKSWPDDGEMDIMEEVGAVPNEVSSSLHAKGHYHVEGTQVTAARKIENAEGAFHVYAMEWTPDNITTYVDGVKLLSYNNDGSGDINWPYHTPFYVILNLAWGGDWGGMNGVNESALPLTMLVDYVRVFQKP